MKAGAALVDITPKPGTQLAGYVGRRRPAGTVLDRLYAKAVVFESDRKMLCFLAVDVTIMTKEYADRIRAAAARQFGFDPAAVMVHATQTHSAPAVGHFMVDEEIPLPAGIEFVRGGDLVYAESATERAIQAIGEAIKRLEPVEIATGSGVLDGYAFNRRAVMRDGKVRMPVPYSGLDKPLGDTELRYVEGPMDPEVGVFCARNRDKKMVAMLLHHTCHPVDVFGDNVIFNTGADVSADWPGAWAANERKLHGDTCVGLVLNGCCGNINPWPPFAPDYTPNHKRMGHALAEMTEKIIRTLTFSEESTLDWVSKKVPLTARQVDAAELREAQEYLAKQPVPTPMEDNPEQLDHKWNMSAWLQTVELTRRRTPKIAYEVQVFRVGPAAFVALPGEPFVEGQLAIKIASPTFPTWVVHCTSQYVAYLPTRDAYPRGGHEVFFCKVAPGSLEQVVDEVIGLLKEVFKPASAATTQPVAG